MMSDQIMLVLNGNIENCQYSIPEKGARHITSWICVFSIICIHNTYTLIYVCFCLKTNDFTQQLCWASDFSVQLVATKRGCIYLGATDLAHLVSSCSIHQKRFFYLIQGMWSRWFWSCGADLSLKFCCIFESCAQMRLPDTMLGRETYVAGTACSMIDDFHVVRTIQEYQSVTCCEKNPVQDPSNQRQ